MPRIYVKRDDLNEPIDVGRRLYRMFLLAILFGVLWVKGYLWSAFVFALLLYLYDAIIKPARETEAIDLPEPGPPPRKKRSRWKWEPEDSP
jgi:hypothetical protein